MNKFRRELSKFKNVVIGWGRNYEQIERIHFNNEDIVLENYENTFFGYYDKCPFQSKNGRYILLHTNNHHVKKKAVR